MNISAEAVSASGAASLADAPRIRIIGRPLLLRGPVTQNPPHARAYAGAPYSAGAPSARSSPGVPGSLGVPDSPGAPDSPARLDLDEHRRLYRPPTVTSLHELIALAESVDLRGRGGAAFPFARKLNAVASTALDRGSETVVLVNGTEGEPASGKDKVLLTRTPHLVLGGAVLAARALNAREIVVGVTDDGAVVRSLREAVSEADLTDYVRIVVLPERFITGEGGALVRGVNGEVPIPPGRKVRASDSGVDGLPTLLSNAETFAQLAVLAEIGADGYRKAGTATEPGTILLTVTGPGRVQTVVETPSGTPLIDVLRACGAGIGQGVLTGGYHGGWLGPADAFAVRLTRESMRLAGTALGAGIIVPLEEGVCPLGEIARVARYLGGESAGQCGPCRLGLPALGRAFTALATGRAGKDALAKLQEGGGIVRGRGACLHPDGTARFLLSALEVFSDDVGVHVVNGTCGRPVRQVLPVTGKEEEPVSGLRLAVDWSRCAGHGLCAKLVPELVGLDMFGYPVLAESPVPAKLLRNAKQATEMCPALALTVKRS